MAVIKRGKLLHHIRSMTREPDIFAIIMQMVLGAIENTETMVNQ